METDKGLAVQSPDGAMGAVTGFAALTKNVPYPFTKEFAGGAGKHIHDKFVVVDFDAENPTVLTASSNLAPGGEEARPRAGGLRRRRRPRGSGEGRSRIAGAGGRRGNLPL